MHGYCHVLKERNLLWACDYRILRLNFSVYWGKGVIHGDVDILAFSIQQGNSDIILREMKRKA